MSYSRTLAIMGLSLCWLMQTGCEEYAPRSVRLPPPEPLSQPAWPLTDWDLYVEELRAAASEAAKWSLTSKYLGSSRGRAGSSATEIARDSLLRLRTLSLNWLLYYPQITTRIPLELKDLETLASGLDSQEEWMWEEHGPGGWRRWRTLMKTRAEIASGWLLRLTGEDFATRAQFEAWLARNLGRLQWNQASGRFVTK